MKTLQIIFLTLVLLGLALFGLSYQLPLQIEVEQRAVLSATPDKVFKFLEDPVKWEKWSALNTTADPSMIRLYGGPVTGTGARMQWSGDKVGNGEVVFTESVKYKGLAYKQIENSNGIVSTGNFTLEPAAGGNTNLIWKQNLQIKDEPIARLSGVWYKYQKQEELKAGLLKLEDILTGKDLKKPSKLKMAAANDNAE